MDARRELARRDYQLRPPVVAISDVHELDEAHDHGGATEAFDEIERGVIIQAPLDDGVDLDRREACGAPGLYAAQALGESAESAAHACENIRIQGVQTDGHSPQSVGLQIDRMLP